jgi:hypothetical protein
MHCAFDANFLGHRYFLHLHKMDGKSKLLPYIINFRKHPADCPFICVSWKIDEPEEWWHIMEAANKYLNSRLVEQVKENYLLRIRIRKF